MSKDIIIIGKAPSSRPYIPWDEDWEFWGLAHDKRLLDKLDLVFEIHKEATVDVQWRGKYRDHLSSLSIPVVMQKQFPDIPNCVEYPYAEVEEITKRDWHSTAAYMLGMAILKHPKKIGVYGFDLNSKEEYVNQKPNFMRLVGIAEGRGIEVVIPEQSKLYKHRIYPN